MKAVFWKRLRALLEKIHHKKNNPYYKKYKNLKLKADQDQFKSLPVITEEDLVNTPYKLRVLEEGAGLNKLVFSEKTNKHYLIHRNINEIRKQLSSVTGQRPLVLMEDVYEAIEQCLFFYEKSTLPLIGELLNPAVLYATAKQYKIDSLVTDFKSLETFGKPLASLGLPVKSLIIIDSKPGVPENIPFKKAKIESILSLPETGFIAYVCPVSQSAYHPFPDVYIEPGEQMVITSSRLTGCPIIRYKTDYIAQESNVSCACKKQALKISF